MKYTPGPLEVLQEFRGKGAFVYKENSSVLVAVFASKDFADYALACVNACRDINNPEVVPELLEALEDWVFAERNGNDYPSAYSVAQAKRDIAIAKARGE